MTPSWADVLIAWATLAAALVSGVGVVFIVLQLQAVQRQLVTATCEQLYSRMHDIHLVFINTPSLRPYFYDNAPAPTDAADDYQLVATAAELVADFFQQVSLQLDLMPPTTATGWRAYMADVARRSPALRRRLEQYAQWYPSRLLTIAAATND